MLALLKSFLDIALWRKGPQDLPASGLLLLLTLAANVGSSLAIGLLAADLLEGVRKAADPAAQPVSAVMMLGQMTLELTLTLGWIALMLSLFHQRQRFWQTATAWVGFDLIISPLVVVATIILARSGVTSPLALLMGLFMIAALVWYVMAIAHVVRCAVEVTLFPALLLALTYMGCTYFVSTRVFGITP